MIICGAAIMGLHAYIVHKFPKQRVSSEVVARAQRLAARKAKRERLAAAAAAGEAAICTSSVSTGAASVRVVLSPP